MARLLFSGRDGPGSRPIEIRCCRLQRRCLRIARHTAVDRLFEHPLHRRRLQLVIDGKGTNTCPSGTWGASNQSPRRPPQGIPDEYSTCSTVTRGIVALIGQRRYTFCSIVLPTDWPRRMTGENWHAWEPLEPLEPLESAMGARSSRIPAAREAQTKGQATALAYIRAYAQGRIGMVGCRLSMPRISRQPCSRTDVAGPYLDSTLDMWMLTRGTMR